MGNNASEKTVEHYISSTKRKKNCQPIIFETHLSFKNKGKIKAFSDIQKLEELIISVLTLKEKLMGIL